jgi:hypothetical protein
VGLGAEALKQRGRRAGHGEEVEWLGRAGLLAQGAIYALIALLAIEVAVDGRDSSESPDREGALRLVANQRFGTWLLALLGLGFAAYALWRIAQALADREGKGGDAQGLATRAGYLAVGVWYAGLALLVAETLLESGGQAGPGSGGNAKERTAGLLGLPYGRQLVLAVAAGFLGAACWNVYRALSGKLRKRLRGARLSERGRRVAIAIGGAGHVARGVVFALIAWFLAKSAWEFDPDEARSLDGALLELARHDYGPLVLGTVAAGLMAFALWCAVQAFYRDV